MNYHNYPHHSCKLISQSLPSGINYVNSNDEDKCESQRMWEINTRKTYGLIRVGLNYLRHLLIASISRLKVTLRAILQRNGRDLLLNYLTTLFQLHKL
jgi:hypothetical protein